jgi:hypothetical protein
LRIVVLDGEGAINNVRQRTAREPVVQVVDQNDRPVAGAVVMFVLPDRGASGVFANGELSMTAATDAQGRVTAVGLRPNHVAGDFQIRVTASHDGRTASATISQTNTATGLAAGGGGGGKTIGILLAVAAGAAGGAVVALRRGSNGGGTPSQPTTPATTIAIGAPSVAPPR